MSTRKSTTSHAEPVCHSPGTASATSPANPHTPNIPPGNRNRPAASAGASVIPTAAKNIPNPIQRIVPSGIPGSRLINPASSKSTIPSGISGSQVTGPSPINAASAHHSALRQRADSLNPPTRATAPLAAALTIRNPAPAQKIRLGIITRIHHDTHNARAPTARLHPQKTRAREALYPPTHTHPNLSHRAEPPRYWKSVPLPYPNPTPPHTAPPNPSRTALAAP